MARSEVTINSSPRSFFYNSIPIFSIFFYCQFFPFLFWNTFVRPLFIFLFKIVEISCLSIVLITRWIFSLSRIRFVWSPFYQIIQSSLAKYFSSICVKKSIYLLFVFSIFFNFFFDQRIGKLVSRFPCRFVCIVSFPFNQIFSTLPTIRVLKSIFQSVLRFGREWTHVTLVLEYSLFTDSLLVNSSSYKKNWNYPTKPVIIKIKNKKMILVKYFITFWSVIDNGFNFIFFFDFGTTSRVTHNFSDFLIKSFIRKKSKNVPRP